MIPLNGQPIDLSQLRQPGPGEQLGGIQQMIAASAGVELGARAELVTDLGVRLLDDVQLPIVATPGGVTVFGVSGLVGKTDTAPGRRVLIPWHAINRMGAAS